MYEFMKEKIEKMEEVSDKISKLIKDIKNTPENQLPDRINNLNGGLYSHIIGLYSHLSQFHKDTTTLYGIPKSFPPCSSTVTNIQEISSDYVRIKMPLLYKKDWSGDYILAYDLDRALSEAQKKGISLPFMEKMEIIFTFYYLTTESKFIRDNDNYALKPVINTIMRHMRSADRGDKAWLSLRTIVKENIENHTIIEIRRLT